MNYPGIRRLRTGVYRVRVTRRTPTGKRLERDRVCHGSLDDARDLLLQLEAELEAEYQGTPNERMTLTAYVRLWIERRAPQLKPSTLAKYMNDLEKHILPRLGDRWVDELKPTDIAGFVTTDRGRGYSVVNRLRLLRTIAKDAEADGYADRDFCARVRAPSVTVYTDDQPNLLNIEALDRLIIAIPEAWLDVALVLALTGLRWGEISAVRWEDIDLERAVMVIRRGNWKGHILTPKTTASCREIPLSGPLPARLRRRRERMERAQHPGLKAGWVFPTQRGTIHRGSPLRVVLHDACKRAGITIRFTPHGLRRTWNNMARRLADPMVVRAIVGHATEAMTAHYSRVDTDEKRAATDAVAAMVAQSGAGGGRRISAIEDKALASEGGGDLGGEPQSEEGAKTEKPE